MLLDCQAGTVIQLRPYVHPSVHLTNKQKREIYGKLPHGGLTGLHYYAIAPRAEDVAAAAPAPLEEEKSGAASMLQGLFGGRK